MIIGIKRIGRDTIIYGIDTSLYYYFTALSQQGLYDFLKSFPFAIEVAFISLHQPYRNTLYALYPSIQIVIWKAELVNLFLNTLEIENKIIQNEIVENEVVENKIIQNEVIEEVAVSIVPVSIVPEESMIGNYFIEALYQVTSRREAILLYEKWQAYIPLNNKKVYRLVRIMEFYYDEIFSYFELDSSIRNACACSK